MKTAVLIPCYNEEKAISRVIRDFRAELPEAEIIVFDNGSTDQSLRLAQEEMAKVITIKKRGKGYMVQKMFETVEADIYVLVDGDDTYAAKDVHRLIKPVVEDNADMVIGRRTLLTDSAMKTINKLGNLLFSKLFSIFFMIKLRDVLSGYRVINKNLVQRIPILTHEFQVEMEMTIQSLYRGMRVIEVPVGYRERVKGSFSKLHPLRDGSLVLLTLLALIRDLRPLAFFGYISVVLFISVLTYGFWIYFAPRQATLLDTVVIISLAIIGWLFMSMGLFLHTLNRRFLELNVLMMRKNKL